MKKKMEVLLNREHLQKIGKDFIFIYKKTTRDLLKTDNGKEEYSPWSLNCSTLKSYFTVDSNMLEKNILKAAIIVSFKEGAIKEGEKSLGTILLDESWVPVREDHTILFTSMFDENAQLLFKYINIQTKDIIFLENLIDDNTYSLMAIETK